MGVYKIKMSGSLRRYVAYIRLDLVGVIDRRHQDLELYMIGAELIMRFMYVHVVHGGK